MNGQIALQDNFSGINSWRIPDGLDGVLASFSNGGQSSNSSLDLRPWDAPARITVSLAPDGTRVAGYSSSLFDPFRTMLQPPELVDMVAEAMRSWSSRAGLNLGFVTDGGEDFGTSGLTQLDSRFGDIRIGAIPLGPEVYAVATPFDDGASGTWAGDILLNSNATFDSLDQFYSVVVHEFGHALGLPHTGGEGDIMNPAAFNTVQTRRDIAALRLRYGRRRLDQYDDVDPKDRNNSMENATRLKNPGSFKNTVPLIAYGDVQGDRDVDWFELRALGDDYQGPVTFRVVTSGISLLSPRLSIYDESGERIAVVVSKSTIGDDLSLTVQAPIDESLFVRVSNSGIFHRGRGSYSLVATMDASATYDPETLEFALHQDFWALDQSDVHTLFTEPEPLFNNDLHTNETFSTATDLDEVSGSVVPGHFRIQAGISDVTDIDIYRFRAPDLAGGAGTLTASLLSLEQEGLVPSLQFYNASFQTLSQRVIARGNGRYLVQIDGVAANSDYYVGIRSDRPGEAFDTGNYTFDLLFNRPKYELDNLGSGTLGTQDRSEQHTLYVAETQMFHFGIKAGFNTQLAGTTIWGSVYNEEGDLVWRGHTRPGEFRSANSVVLRPGSYLIQVDLAGSAATAGTLAYTLQGKVLSDPIGPELINPANLPFPHCKPGSPEFCYPGDRQTTDPFLVVGGGEIGVPPGSTTPPPDQNVNLWYWYENWNAPVGG